MQCNANQQENNLFNEIAGAQATSRNLQSNIQELDARSLKQQEMLYAIEYQVQTLERKVRSPSSFLSSWRSAPILLCLSVPSDLI